MRILYSLLGLVARLNERLSHFSINCLPFNWIVMVLLGGVCPTLFMGLGDTLQNGHQPEALGVAEVMSHRAHQNYVTLHGVPHTDMAIEKTVSDGVIESWTPLVDPASNCSVLVQTEISASTGSLSIPATVTGMLRPMPKELKEELRASGYGGNVDVAQVLVQGDHPGDRLHSILWALIFGSAFALFAATYLMRYVVFQRTGRRVVRTGDSSGYPAAGIDLRLTGCMTLDGGDRKRFLNVPAALATLEQGELALVSNIDASSYFMGIRMAKRAGIWASIIQPGTLKDSELGLLYIGLATRPAVRVRYVDAATGKRAVSILSFNTERERQIVIQDLDGFAGHTTTATVVR